ncbi:DUF2680 domain-containing protein [Thermodesulfobacteriota bacterium]
MKPINIATACLAIVFLLISQAARAQDMRPERRGGGGKGCFSSLTSTLQTNIFAEVLAGFAGKDTDVIKQELAGQRRSVLLQHYEVDQEAFRSAMQTKQAEAVKKIAGTGLITQQQADLIIRQMQNRKDQRQQGLRGGSRRNDQQRGPGQGRGQSRGQGSYGYDY